MTDVRQEIALHSIHLVQLHVGLRQLIDLAVQVGVGTSQLLLRVDQVPQHSIVGVG